MESGQPVVDRDGHGANLVGFRAEDPDQLHADERCRVVCVNGFCEGDSFRGWASAIIQSSGECWVQIFYAWWKVRGGGVGSLLHVGGGSAFALLEEFAV